jgi:hypothetical protein
MSGAHVSTEGELDVQDNGEVGEDEEDDEVEDDAVDNDEGEEEVEEEVLAITFALLSSSYLNTWFYVQFKPLCLAGVILFGAEWTT